MNGRERRADEWEGWREARGEGGRDGGYVTLRFRSASRELVTHTVRLGRGGGDGEERRSERRTEGGGGEGDREKGVGEERGIEGRKGGVRSFFFLVLPFIFFSFPSLHPPSVM